MKKFQWGRNKEKKEEQPEMSTLEQVKKAYEDLSEEDKKSFHQSIKDRMHESVGEQEHLDGDEDSQDAKDRVHEAEGEERAVEERREDDHEERQDERDERHDERLDDVYKRLDAIDAKLDALTKKPKEADNDSSAELDKITKVWG